MRWRAALVVLALLAAFVPIPRSFIEDIYAHQFFPAIQPIITGASNSVSFALFDALVVIVVFSWVAMTVGDLASIWRTGWRTGRLRGLVRIPVRTATWVAGFYLLFLLIWGFNYRRAPLSDKLQFDAARVSSGAALTLATTTVRRMNALYAVAHKEGWRSADQTDPALVQAFVATEHDLQLPPLVVPARPRESIFDLYFLRAGVSGMTDPYFLETLVASDLLPFERPFVVAHEWSHLAGIGDEGNANFVGWLTCLHGGPSHQYSAWVFLYSEIVPTIDPVKAQILADGLGDGPRADLQAVRERLRLHVDPRIAQAGWRVYDRYLKANHVEEGNASYAQVVRLILGSTFSPEWAPALR